MLGLCVLYVQAWPTCLPSTGEVAQFCTIYPPLHLAARLGPVWIPGVGFSLGSHCDEAQSLVGLSDWAETVNRRSEDGETILTRRTRRSVFFLFFFWSGFSQLSVSAHYLQYVYIMSDCYYLFPAFSPTRPVYISLWLPGACQLSCSQSNLAFTFAPGVYGWILINCWHTWKWNYIHASHNNNRLNAHCGSCYCHVLYWSWSTVVLIYVECRQAHGAGTYQN